MSFATGTRLSRSLRRCRQARRRPPGSRPPDATTSTLLPRIAERSGGALYNSAVVIGPSGYVGTFRKVHLWAAQNLFFEPGDLGFPVFKTPIGRIGVAGTCYDGWFPETFRLQALQGADVVCVPPTGCQFRVRNRDVPRWPTFYTRPQRTRTPSSSLAPTA